MTRVHTEDEKIFPTPAQLAALLVRLSSRPQGIPCFIILGPADPIHLVFRLREQQAALAWLHRKGYVVIEGRPEESAVCACRQNLAAFLAGNQREFYPLSPSPFLAQGTAFQQRVWAELSRIPYGQTRTYGEIATALGNRHLARAVGRACGANPCALVIPCHRVVASNSLGGFGGGPAIKQKLLAIEAEAEKVNPLPAF